jgi:hypothetical protein
VWKGRWNGQRGYTAALTSILALTKRAVGLPVGEGIARARVAKAMREKRVNFARENMATKVKRKEWERLKGWGVNKTKAGVFYRVFQSEIIQQRLSTEESVTTKEGQEVDQA